MSMDFPSNPNMGDLYQPPAPSSLTYQWNGTGWRVYGNDIVPPLGGFNLQEEVDLDGLGSVATQWLPLAVAYDYDLELLAPSVAVNSTSFFHLELSPDGGTTVRSADFVRAQMYGAGTGIINAQTDTITSIDATAFITSNNGVGSFNGSAFVKLRLHDEADKRTIIQSQSTTFGDGSNEGARYDSHFEQNGTPEIADSVRLVLSGGATIAGGLFRIYRRSRGIINP